MTLRERFIVSKNVNDDRGLSELFDELTKPEFLFYKQEERGWYINTLEYFLKADESFDSIFIFLILTLTMKSLIKGSSCAFCSNALLVTTARLYRTNQKIKLMGQPSLDSLFKYRKNPEVQLTI